ncbi:radical SAM protein [Candidatus Magnetomorum sp. HK-1]|nr:radical SAM protein [Candidatus Magnetomorum sp. HK-1]
MKNREDQFYLPSYVNIELTNHCNMKCIICPHGHNLIKNKGYMDFEVYKKIIDELWECSDFKPDRINLVGVGESLLHPQFIDMANYLKKTNYIRDLVTNAYFLTPDKSDEIIENDALDII